MPAKLTPEQEEAVNKAVEERLDLLKKEGKLLTQNKKTREDLENMSKEELRRHIDINKRQADAIAHNMKMAAAYGDITGALQAAKELEEQVQDVREAAQQSLSSHKYIQDQIAEKQKEM